jgi:phage portal protein BeeE
MFGESHLEIARQDGAMKNLLVLSAKNVYTDLDRTFLVQSIQSGEKANRFKIFRPYGEATSTERDCLSLVRQTPFDDIYGLPVYTPALAAIESNRKIAAANIETMDNTIKGSTAIELSGDLTPDAQQKIFDSYRTLKTRKGGTTIVHLPPGVTINTRTIGATSVDGDYLQEREKNELEIMAMHGVPAELYGTMQTGGISSGEKATGALKIFKQTVVSPEQESLSIFIEYVFRKEFPGYSAGFKLKELDLTDSLEDQQAEQLKSSIQQTYINIGSIRLLNEYRESIGLVALTDAEFAVITANNIQPNFSQPAAF